MPAPQSPAPPSTSSRPRVVIVGAGFGGLYAARSLRGAPVDVVVVDRENHHLFQPLLYQVATAALTGPDIARPIRGILRKSANTSVLLGEVSGIELERKRVRLADGELEYDYLVLAAGSATSWFGRDAWRRHALGLKDLADAYEVRRRVLLAFEAAEREDDPELRAALTTFAIVGAGPTGVELAGALREIATRTLASDFRRVDPTATRVVLIEAGERVLAAFPPKLSAAAKRMLERRGVEVRLRSLVTDVDAEGVQLGDERVRARTVLWAAGVAASPIGGSLHVPLARDGRVLVEPDLSIPRHPEAFVVGDLAAAHDGEGFLPGLAQVAIQGGRHAARCIRARVAGEPTKPFRYRDPGLLATVGRASAVARIGRLSMTGFPAWILWLFVHVAWLIGFRNRLAVLLGWGWAYLTWQHAARVVPRSGGESGGTARRDETRASDP